MQIHTRLNGYFDFYNEHGILHVIYGDEKRDTLCKMIHDRARDIAELTGIRVGRVAISVNFTKHMDRYSFVLKAFLYDRWDRMVNIDEDKRFADDEVHIFEDFFEKVFENDYIGLEKGELRINMSFEI